MSRQPPPIVPRKTKMIAPIIPERSELGALNTVAETEQAGQLPPGTTEVMKWLIDSGLIPSLFQMSKLDPQGMLTYRTLRPLHEIGATANGSVTPATAMYNSAARKAKSLELQFRGMDVDWIIANGNRGPDDSQVAYYRHNGKLPAPGTNQGAILTRPSTQLEALEARGFSKLDGKIENLMKSDVYSTPWMLNELRRFGKKSGRIPNTEELNELRKQDPERPGKMEEFKRSRGMGQQQNMNFMPTEVSTKYYSIQQPAPGVLDEPQESAYPQPSAQARAVPKGRSSRFLAGLRGNSGLQ